MVALLLAIPTKFDLGSWTKQLPHCIGAINMVTSAVLVIGWICIRAGECGDASQRNAHGLWARSGFFGLLCSVPFDEPIDEVWGRGLDKGRLLFRPSVAHSLVFGGLPLVLRALWFALLKRFDQHRRIAKFAYPIWLYVSITGVIAYWMISPYYQH